MRLRCIAAFLVVQVGLSEESVRAEELWPLERVVAALRQRENSLLAVSAVVAKRDAPGADYQELFRAREEYSRALGRLAGLNQDAISSRADITRLPDDFVWRFRWEPGGVIALDYLLEKVGEVLNDTERSVYFDGEVAEYYRPEEGQVHLRGEYLLPPLMEVLGFGSSYGSFDVSQPSPYRYVSLADRLALAQSRGVLVESRLVDDPEHGKLIELWMRYRLTSLYPEHPFYGEVALLLDPNRGLAPLRFTFRVLVREADTYIETMAGGVCQGAWEQHEKHLPGLWLARSFRFDGLSHVLVPSPGPDFKHLLDNNGHPVWVRGAPRIDPSSARLVTFHGRRCEYTVKELAINESVSIPEPPVYPVGTLIFDDRTNELFQVEGVPASVRNAVKRHLDVATGQPITTRVVRPRTDVTLILVVGNVLLLAAIGVLWWLRRRSRA